MNSMLHLYPLSSHLSNQFWVIALLTDLTFFEITLLTPSAAERRSISLQFSTYSLLGSTLAKDSQSLAWLLLLRASYRTVGLIRDWNISRFPLLIEYRSCHFAHWPSITYHWFSSTGWLGSTRNRQTVLICRLFNYFTWSTGISTSDPRNRGREVGMNHSPCLSD